MTVWTVLVAAMVTAIATGLGALPLFFVKELSRRWLGIANGIAAGLMLGASHGLITDSLQYSLARTIAGIVIGLAFILLARRALKGRDEFRIGELRGANALKALIIVGAMTLHSFSEGVGVGVSFGGSEGLGVLITTAIAIHNIPEGLAISLVIVPRGASVSQAVAWSVFSSLPQPLMAIPAYLFVTTFREILPVGLGIAAGAMIWMVFSEMVPDAVNDTSPQVVGAIVALSIAAMIVLQHVL